MLCDVGCAKEVGGIGKRGVGKRVGSGCRARLSLCRWGQCGNQIGMEAAVLGARHQQGRPSGGFRNAGLLGRLW
jgi:hypothetical protein